VSYTSQVKSSSTPLGASLINVFLLPQRIYHHSHARTLTHSLSLSHTPSCNSMATYAKDIGTLKSNNRERIWTENNYDGGKNSMKFFKKLSFLSKKLYFESYFFRLLGPIHTKYFCTPYWDKKIKWHLSSNIFPVLQNLQLCLLKPNFKIF